MGDNKQQEPLNLSDLGGALPSGISLSLLSPSRLIFSCADVFWDWIVGLSAEDRAGLVSALKVRALVVWF